MAKIITWRIKTDSAEHVVTYSFHKLTGRMTVTLDGEAFELSSGPLGLGAARREPFRIVGADGEAEQAVLTIDRLGRPALFFRSEEIPFEQERSGVSVEMRLGKRG